MARSQSPPRRQRADPRDCRASRSLEAAPRSGPPLPHHWSRASPRSSVYSQRSQPGRHVEAMYRSRLRGAHQVEPATGTSPIRIVAGRPPKREQKRVAPDVTSSSSAALVVQPAKPDGHARAAHRQLRRPAPGAELCLEENVSGAASGVEIPRITPALPGVEHHNACRRRPGTADDEHVPACAPEPRADLARANQDPLSPPRAVRTRDCTRRSIRRPVARTPAQRRQPPARRPAGPEGWHHPAREKERQEQEDRAPPSPRDLLPAESPCAHRGAGHSCVRLSFGNRGMVRPPSMMMAAR